MPYSVQLNESNASRRIVYLWCVGSNGTTPAASEQGGQPTFSLAGGPTISTASTLRAWNAGQGEYYVTLTASEVSVVGQGVIRYNSATALETATPFQVVAYDSGDSMRLGLFALPNAAPTAANGLITAGIGGAQLNPTAGNVILAAMVHSGATIQGVTRVNSSVTPADAIYSAVSVRLDAVTYSGVTLQVNNIAPATYSGVTVEISNIAPATYSGVSVGVANIVQSARSLIADDLLLRSIAGGSPGGRTVQDALRALRNNVQISGSVMTVFTEDDVTSAWTASVTTTADTSIIAGVDPGGP